MLLLLRLSLEAWGMVPLNAVNGVLKHGEWSLEAYGNGHPQALSSE